MHRKTYASIWMFVSALTVAACASSSGSGDRESASATSSEELAFQKQESVQYKARCDVAKAKPGEAHCHSLVAVDAQGKAQASSAPIGGTWGAADLVSAYNIPSGGGSGKTVAIVDAQDDPTAEADLAVYRKQYGLPACTTANGCFKKVNQNGKASPLPSADPDWAGEISLDLDMVSAACPECKILLVEANSQSILDLGAAVNTAVSLGATTVSNSYGAGEEDWEIPATQADPEFYQHSGVAIFASAGDSGYNHPNNGTSTRTGAAFPASGSKVISVGGTTLAKSTSSRGWAEKAWVDGGSGCSHTIAKPSWQTDTGCSNKTVADISAVALNLAVYDTTVDTSQGESPGWQNFAGTSASSPLVAAIYAKTGHGADTAQAIWTNTGNFYDVTSGSNGSCSGSYLCTAKTGYDAPTGWGSPNAGLLAGNGGGGGSDGGTPPPPSTCSHDKCTSGGKLVSSCDSCVSQVCAQDSFCCSNSWDSICVGEVGSICGQTCN